MGQSERWRRIRGPLSLLLLYVIPLFLSWDLASQRGGAAGTLRYLAVVAGLTGLTSFAVNIILGARLPLVDRFFGGLEPMYVIHQINGRIAYLLILAHLLLVVGDRSLAGSGAVGELLTGPGGPAVLLGLAAFVGMTVAIGMTLYVRLTHEVFVYVQRSFGLVFLVGALHAFMTPGAKSQSRLLTLYLGSMALAALAAFAYRSLLGDVLVRRFDYLVTKVRQLDRMVVEITMEPVDRRLVAIPGQFVFVTFYSDSFNARFHPVTFVSEGGSGVIVVRPGDAHNQFHPFSLTSEPDDPHLSLVIKAVGDFTAALPALERGATARIEGPYGDFSYLNAASPRQVWLAGGIGITPFLSMARSLRGDRYEIDLFWGVKSRAQAYFLDELHAIAQRVPGFTVHLVPEDEQGFISAPFVAERADLQDRDILIVGPPAMERALRTQFQQAGLPRDRIHSERFAFGPRR